MEANKAASRRILEEIFGAGRYEIAGELNRQVEDARSEELARADVDESQDVCDGGRRVQIVDRQDFGDGVLNDERGQQQRGDDHHADRDEHPGI